MVWLRGRARDMPHSRDSASSLLEAVYLSSGLLRKRGKMLVALARTPEGTPRGS